MKTLVPFLLLPFFLICVAASAQPKNRDEFILKGTVNYPADRFIYFVWYNADEVRFKDSAKVTNGHFYYKGKSGGYTDRFYIKSNPDQKANKDETDNVEIPIDNSVMTVSLNTGHFSKYSLKNCRSCTSLQEQMKYFDNKYLKKAKLYFDSAEAKPPGEARRYYEEVNMKIEEKCRRELLTWCVNHPDDNLAALNLVGYADHENNPDSIRFYYERLSKFQQQSYYGRTLKKAMEHMYARRNLVGAKAPEFSRVGVDSNIVDLEVLCKDHYVLLDFWATWCLPCRASHPALGKLFDKYAKEGLIMIGIAQNDNDVLNRQKVIKDDGLQRWYNILNASDPYSSSKEKSLSDLYDIDGIPTKILIDGNGNIVGRYSDEKDLEKALESIRHF